MNGNEYEKVVQEAGALAKARDLFCFCGFNDPITRVCFRAGKTKSDAMNTFANSLSF